MQKKLPKGKVTNAATGFNRIKKKKKKKGVQRGIRWVSINRNVEWWRGGA